MAELRKYWGTDICAFGHGKWRGQLHGVPYMLQAGPESELLKPKKSMAKEEFSKELSTLGRDSEGGNRCGMCAPFWMILDAGIVGMLSPNIFMNMAYWHSQGGQHRLRAKVPNQTAKRTLYSTRRSGFYMKLRYL